MGHWISLKNLSRPNAIGAAVKATRMRVARSSRPFSSGALATVKVRSGTNTLVRMLRVRLVGGWPLLAAAVAAFAAAGATASASASAQRPPHAILAVVAADPGDILLASDGPPTDLLLRFLGAVPALRAGLWSSAQSRYARQQALLDISQGARQPATLHADVDADADGELDSLRFELARRSFANWRPFRARARDVSQTLRPGLLAASVPRGAAFVAAPGVPTSPAIAAADERGRVAAISLGAVGTLAARAQMQARTHRLVVVSLPAGSAGRTQLSQLARERAPAGLLLVVQLPETPRPGAFGAPPGRFLRQPAFAIGDGLRGSPRSESTRREGLVVSVDIAPTILAWLGVERPAHMRGLPIAAGEPLSAARLEELRLRWSSIRDGRQTESYTAILLLAGILFLVLGTWRGVGFAARPALRIGALASLWWPSVVLLAALVEPATRTGEVALIAGVSVVLAGVTERLLPWARAPLAPALVCLTAYTVDLAFGGPLLTRSVLGPSVAAGSRFYGVSNELEPILPIVLLVALAAITTGRQTTARTLTLYAGAGLALLVVVGWGRLGADVGGVITVGAGVAVATLVMLPGAVTARRVAFAALVPVAGLALLIVIDVGLSSGSHLTRNLLRAEDPGELWELVTRRYELAWGVLRNGKALAYLLAALLAVAFAWRNRERLYGRLPHRGWAAALIGGLAAGLAGALTNDSGPVLFINAVVALTAITAYLLGRPDGTAAATAAR